MDETLKERVQNVLSSFEGSTDLVVPRKPLKQQKILAERKC